MGTAAPDKRRGRELVGDAIGDLHAARQCLYGVIGEMDPVKVQRVVRDVLTQLDGVAWSLNEVDTLYALRARRGPYSNGSGDEDE